jgi:hypothetical protein
MANNDSRSTLQEQLQSVSDRMEAGEDADTIIASEDAADEAELKETQKAVEAAAEQEEQEEGAEATTEIPDPDEAGEEEDAPIGEPEGDPSEDEGETALTPPAHWNSKQTEAWNNIPEEQQSSAMALVKTIDVALSNKATELDLVKRRVATIDSVSQPYQAMLSAENATPESALKSYLESSYVLRSGTPKQKAGLLRQMADTYGIDLYAVEDESSLETEQPQFSEEQLNSIIEQKLQSHTSRASIENEVSTFVEVTDADGNKLHPHFEKLSPTIAAFVNTGQSLNDAYHSAVRADPDLYQEAVKAEVKAATTARTDVDTKKVSKAKKAAGVRVNGTKAPKAGPSVKDETMVQTMARVEAELSSEESRL